MDPVRHVRQTVPLPYRWSYGRNLTTFFSELRDHQRFVAKRCPKCRGVIVPPVEVCGRCFVRCEPGWIEVGPGGTLHSYTTVHLPFPGQPTEPPYVFAMIRLDGADTFLSHRVAEAEERDLSVDLRVEPVWNPQRRGGLHDVLYFRPARPAPGAEVKPMSLTVKEIFEGMSRSFQPEAAGDWTTRVQFEVTGEGGGDWVVEIALGACKTAPGRIEDPKATVTTSAETWIGMVTGTVNPQMAFMTGKLRIKGNMADVLKISNPKIFPRKP